MSFWYHEIMDGLPGLLGDRCVFRNFFWSTRDEWGRVLLDHTSYNISQPYHYLVIEFQRTSKLLHAFFISPNPKSLSFPIANVLLSLTRSCQYQPGSTSLLDLRSLKFDHRGWSLEERCSKVHWSPQSVGGGANQDTHVGCSCECVVCLVGGLWCGLACDRVGLNGKKSRCSINMFKAQSWIHSSSTWKGTRICTGVVVLLPSCNVLQVRGKEQDSYKASTRDRGLTLKVVKKAKSIVEGFYKSKDPTSFSQEEASPPKVPWNIGKFSQW